MILSTRSASPTLPSHWLLRTNSSRLNCASCVITLSIVSFFGGVAKLAGQAVDTSAAAIQKNDTQHIDDIERRLTDMAGALAQTQAALQQSQAELLKLRAEIIALRAKGGTEPAAPPMDAVTEDPGESATLNRAMRAQIDSLKEQQDLLQAEVKVHDQIKIESASKYNLTVTGMALFNAFSNAGVVDNAELPALALPRTPGASHGSTGASLRQTVFGLAASGPVIGGAQSFATINLDFFGGTNTNAYGYTGLDGYVRMRDSEIGLAWKKTRVRAGYTAPLISPLSPTSFATVAQPALSGSGNLWTWSPQVQIQQDLALREKNGLSLQAGLLYPESPGYSSIQIVSPVDASRHPAVEGRIAYRADVTPSASTRSFAIGVSGYSSNQFYSSNTHIHSWAVAGDWQIPLPARFDLSGEIYRGRALGGLGGGVYKDVLSGVNPITGQYLTVGVETAGGWTQLKFNGDRRIEANAMFGLDDAFTSSYKEVVLPASSSFLTLTTRNSTVTGNLIFRPLSSLILSPEYRRITTWRYNGDAYVANIFTLSAGYKF
ncbi:hypothetical protein HDF16_004417 [Granulicella aggregans]|uniref:DUF3138 family protein n=1 Tax=Granulicella aggregans TaxID=474949 RepID=A0A7W7ZH44_9BACT|nr:hypothetical protein [Granulicella aggregans]MBB5059691.1 hypothetical protein [Granulicella aggregans]